MGHGLALKTVSETARKAGWKIVEMDSAEYMTRYKKQKQVSC